MKIEQDDKHRVEARLTDGRTFLHECDGTAKCTAMEELHGMGVTRWGQIERATSVTTRGVWECDPSDPMSLNMRKVVPSAGAIDSER